MHSERTLLDLTGLAYEAAADPAQWTTLLERLRGVLAAPWCFFFVQHLQSRTADVHAEIGFDPAYVRSYEAYYAAKNPTFTHAPHALQPGRVRRSQELRPEPLFLRSEFHHDWALPQRLGQGAATVVTRNPEQVGLFGILREFGRPNLDAGDMQLLQALTPHLERAVQLHGRLRELEVLQQTAADALDRWSTGVIILDRRGRIVQTNQAADIILARRDGLLREPQLSAQLPSENRALQAAIQRAVSAMTKAQSTGGGAVRISRTAQRPLALQVSPIAPRSSPAARARVAAIVFVSDPDGQAKTDSQMLRELYGLTRAESAVTERLVHGDSAKRICAALAITQNTLKTHTRHILAKTHTRRQSELTALILSNNLLMK